MSLLPIIQIGNNPRHTPILPENFFFGLLSSWTEQRMHIPYAYGEGYFFDLRRGKGTILPYCATNVDGNQQIKADRIRLDAITPEDEMCLIPKIVWTGFCENREFKIWESYLPVKWSANLVSAIDEFKSFFPGLTVEVNI